MRVAARSPARSLAGRLALAVFASVALALMVATALALWREVSRYGEAKREALTAIAEIFAATGARAAATGDAVIAQQTLRAIARRPDLIYAGIERPDGSTLADQGLAVRLATDLDLDGPVSTFDLLASRTAQVRLPIRDNGSQVGSIVLVADTTDLTGRLLALVQASALASALALGLGLLVSYRLQRSITRPLAALAGTMDQVREGQDYTRSAAIVRDDEVGVLAGAFNALLETVRDRDRRLARHMGRLERDVAERTADLFDAKEAAEAANTAKSAFLATMSHEIRTPLNGMLVMAEMLAAADLPLRQRRCAEVIARSGQSLLAIINDILDFAKVEAGKLDLERIPVSPAEIVDTVIALYAEKAREAGIDLAAFVDPATPRLMLGDPVRLGQILGNFVNNALKFTAAGSVFVRVERDGARLRMLVRDTGIGIAADTLPTIFSAFSQADQSTTRRFGGTGLGLSIAQRLTEAMGGRIGVDSAPGEGSTFWIALPVEAEEAAPVIARAGHIHPALVVSAGGGATRAALRERSDAAGFTPSPPGADEAAHWIADAADILALGARPTATGRVLAIARMGDPAASAILEAGWADDVLRWPVAQEELDAALAALATGAAFEARARAPRAALPQFPAARVLVADDSAVNREVALEALARFGVTAIATAEDGRAALDARKAKAFDLILMDGSMPALDGYESARAIRAWESQTGARPVAIVALTAHVIGEAAAAWRECGMDGALAKPFTLASLADALCAHLPPGGSATLASPAEDHTPGSLLDDDVIEGLADMAEAGGGGFAARIVRLYAEHAPTALCELEDARREADCAAVARAAHSLKSMSLNIGGKALAAALAVIEEAARVDRACPREAALIEIADLLARTMTAVRERLTIEARPDDERGDQATAARSPP